MNLAPHDWTIALRRAAIALLIAAGLASLVAGAIYLGSAVPWTYK